jgi:hypothetical protein
MRVFCNLEHRRHDFPINIREATWRRKGPKRLIG